MLAHVGLITWGYAAGDLGAVPGTFWNLTVTYPGMLLALAGTLCLVVVVVVVVVTSIKAARSRLRHESWHLLHLYAYVGVGLALPHQLWTGQGFLSSPLPPPTGGRCGPRPPPRCSSGGSGCRSSGRCATTCG